MKKEKCASFFWALVRAKLHGTGALLAASPLLASSSAWGFDPYGAEKNLARVLSVLPGVELGGGAGAFGGVSVSTSYLKFPWPVVWQQAGARYAKGDGFCFQYQGGLSLGIVFGGAGVRANGQAVSPFWTVGVPLFPMALLVDGSKEWDEVGWPVATLLFSSLWVERDMSRAGATFVGVSFRFPVLLGMVSGRER